MASITITITSDSHTVQELEDLRKDFALATGWAETVLDENDNTITNPETYQDYVVKPIGKYFRQTLVAYQSKKAMEATKTTVESVTNAALDAITVTTGVQA